MGGAERYVHETAALLRARGVRSTLLYQVESRVDPAYISPFEGAYPLVDLATQLAELRPDVVYAHRLAEGPLIDALASSSVPVLRFFHDHKLFCLREHKYTAVGHHTCRDPAGLRCYPCLGFVRRGSGKLPVELVSLGALLRDQRRNQGLSAFAVGSRYMRGQLVEHGFSPDRVRVLPLYVTPPSSVPAARRERDLVLFVGQLVRGKGVDLLLRAAAAARSRPRLLLVGDGRQADEIRALTGELGLGSRVEMIGAVAPSALPELYARARCLAMPSRSPETFGLSGLEAMAHGLPVVAADVGGIGEWLREGEGGVFFPSGDVGALARAIDRMIEEPDLAEEIGRRGVEAHRRRFLPEHHLAALLPALEQLAQLSREGAR
ncbi:MAG: glycosyltransferase family 4 protein [Byssovorax sp.]